MADTVTKGVEIDVTMNTSTVSRQVNQLRKEFRTFESDIRNIEKALNFDEQTNDLLKQRTHQLEGALKSAKNEVSKLTEAMSDLRNKGITDENYRTYVLLATKLAEAKSHVTEMSAKLNDVTSGLTRSIELADKYEKTFNSAKKAAEDMASVNNRNSMFNENYGTREIALLEKASKEAQREVKNLEKALTALNSEGVAPDDERYASLVKRLFDARENAKGAAQALAEGRQRVIDMESGFTKLTNLAATYKQKVEDISKVAKDLDVVLKSSNSYNMNVAVAEMDQLKRIVEETEKELGALRGGLTSLGSQGLTESNARFAEQLRLITECEARLKESKNNLAETEKYINQLRTGYTAAAEQAKILGDRSAESKTAAEQLAAIMKNSGTYDTKYAVNQMEYLKRSTRDAELQLVEMNKQLEAMSAMGLNINDASFVALMKDISDTTVKLRETKQSMEDLKVSTAGMDSGFTLLVDHAKKLAETLKTVSATSDNVSKLVDGNFSKQYEPISAAAAQTKLWNEELTLAKQRFAELSQAMNIQFAKGVDYTNKEMADLAVQVQETEKYMADLRKKMDDAADAAENNGKSTAELLDNYSNLTDKFKDKAIANLKKEFDSASNAAKALNEAFKLDPSGFKDTESAIKAFNKGIETAEEYAKGLKIKLDDLRKSDAFDESSEDAAKLKLEIAKLEDAVKKYKAAIDAMKQGKTPEQVMKEQAEAAKEAAKETENAAKAAEKMKPASERAADGISAFSVALGHLASTAIRRAFSSLRNLSQEVINTGIEFQESLGSIKAVMAVSDESFSEDRFAALSNTFRELALNSEMSATEISNSAQSLALAGYSMDEIQGALPNVIKLSQATGESIEELASYVVDGLSQFGKGSEYASEFTDILAKTAFSTNTNVGQMGEAFKYAGTVAGSLGYRVEDVAVALGIMASNGIKGSQAGTTLRTVLSRLAANTSDARDAIEKIGVSFFDAKGNALPLMEVLDNLRDKTAKMNDEDFAELANKIGGVRGLGGLTAILRSADSDWIELKKNVSEYAGTVEEANNVRLDNLYGDVAKLKNAWSEYSLELSDRINPQTRTFVKNMKDLISGDDMKRINTQIGNLASKGMKMFNDVIVSLSKNLPNVIAGFKNIGTVVVAGGIVGKISKATEGISKWNKELLAMGNTSGVGIASFASEFGLVVSGVTLAVGALKILGDTVEGMYQSNHPALMKLRADYDELAISKDNSLSAFNESNKAMSDEYQTMSSLVGELDKYVGANGEIKEGYESRVKYILGELSNAYGIEVDIVDGVISKYAEFRRSIEETIQAQANAKLQSSINERMTDGILESAKAQAGLTEATANYANELKKLAESEDATNLNSRERSDVWTALSYAANKTVPQLIQEFKEMDVESRMQFLEENPQLWSRGLRDAANEVARFKDEIGDSAEETSKLEAALALLQAGNFTGAVKLLEIDGSVTEAMSAFDELKAKQQEYLAYQDIYNEAMANDQFQAASKIREIMLEQLGGLEEIVNRVKTENPELDLSFIDLDKMAEDIGAVEEHAATVTSAFVDATGEHAEELKSAGTEMVGEVGEGIAEGEELATSEAENVATGVYDTFNTTLSSENAATIGRGWLEGLYNGLTDEGLKSNILGAAQSLAESIPENCRVVLQINSPSKVAEKLMGYYGDGLVNGLENSIGRVGSAARRVASVVNTSMALGASAVGGYGSNYSVTQNLTFNGGYSARDGLIVARDLDRLLGGAI